MHDLDFDSLVLTLNMFDLFLMIYLITVKGILTLTVVL
jgi:hypothetical protein